MKIIKQSLYLKTFLIMQLISMANVLKINYFKIFHAKETQRKKYAKMSQRVPNVFFASFALCFGVFA